jgi:beta-ring hydroxylase
MQRIVEAEDEEFEEEYINDQDPSILHFLLVSRENVSNKQLRDDLMTLLIAGHETSAAVLTWTFYLLAQVTEFTILVDFLVSLGCSCTAMGP